MKTILRPSMILSIFIITTLHIANAQEAGTDCHGKTFHCVDEQSYQICVDLPGGRSETLETLAYQCPTNSYCDNEGRIECDSASPPLTTPLTTERPTTTMLSTTTTIATDAPTTSQSMSSCVQAGRIADETDCHSYYVCLPVSHGYNRVHYQCLFGMAFDPVSQRCTEDQSPCQKDFSCNGSGRFPDPLDSGSYYWCLWNGSGYEMFHLECVYGHKYDADQGRCSVRL